MRNMKSIFGFIALLALVSLAGCGGSGGSGSDSPAGTTGITTGTAVDPYVKGAVFQEIAADGVTVLQRESTPSDEYGVFTFAKDLTEGSFVQLKISRKGMHEGAPFEGMLRRKVDSTVAGDMIVSPMTTLLTNGLSEGELTMLLSDAGLDLTMEDLYRDPMLGLDNLSGQVSDEQLKLLHANMALNQFMTTTGQFDAETTDLNDYNNLQLLASLVKANQDLLNEAEFARISSEISNQSGGNSPLLLEDLITSTVQTMRTVVSNAKESHADGTLDMGSIRRAVAVALEGTTRKVMAIYLGRVGEHTPPMNVDGAAVFADECAACHNLGSGGRMDLTGKGTAVIDKIANQHQGRVLSVEQLQALVAHVDAMAPAPTPDPVPNPVVDGQTLYDMNCAGCHKLGDYDLNGSAPDLGGRESVIADKINAGHRSTTLSTAEVTAVVDWVALNPALPVPTPDPTPNPTPDGIALYESECQGCHGPLSNNSLQDRSAAGIQQAIDTNLGGMGMLVLAPEEVQAIADNLPAPAPVPDPVPTPVDGQVLYDNDCASCHTLGDYDVDGFAPELGGQGNLVVSKLEAGHQSLTFSVDERNALATWANANPVAAPTPDPTPIPDPTPTPVSGQAVYDNNCAGCHSLGSYDTNGSAPELGGQGNLVITKLEAGHQGISLSVDELNALADWADANPAPTPPPAPTPDPVPTPISGQAVYDTNCAGCHTMGDYDVDGFAPELGGQGNLVITRIEAGHQSISLSVDELNALADWADANPAPTPPPAPTPDPVPTPVSGQAVYDTNCAGCHTMGDYDVDGFAPELGGQGNLVITRIEAGHQSISLSVDELNALADWADANPAPTPPPAPTPDPVPTPVSGQAVYDNSCAGCHSVNGYDATGSPDLASSGSLVAPKLAAGHNGIDLTAEEEIATADFLDQYQAVAGGPDYSDCTACHAQPPNGSSFPNTAGSHATHNALPEVGNDCSVCHSGATHDDVLDVAILQNYDAKTGVATANADSTCSTVSCHGGATTPDWFNGSIAVETECKTCHSSGTAQYNGYFSGEHNKHVASKGYDCSVCHDTGKLNNGHFSNLSTSGFELSPAATVGGGSTQVGSYANGTCSSVACHGSEKW